jgi:hypothetical protein
MPHAVLTEELVRHVEGHRVLAAVFLTFCFEPGFFEQEILPALLDVGVSHGRGVRLLQMEDALRRDVGPIAVYYDNRGLTASSESAKLDVRRVPILHEHGYFHPKNVLMLVEPVTEEGATGGPRRLVVATMSANLTRAGWWENVEVCHVEAVAENESCAFRDPLRRLIRKVKAISPDGTDHEAIELVYDFVGGLTQREHLSSNGVLHPQMYWGEERVTDFLDRCLKGAADGMCLEVLSPYFDKHDAAPLKALCDRFQPKKVRLLLPREDDESAAFHEEFYDTVKRIPNADWAKLPVNLVRPGGEKDVRRKRRRVHAKVYRFFNPNRKYEAIFVGSANLTSAAHSGKGNIETGFLIEPDLREVSDWWLQLDSARPAQFIAPAPAEEAFPTTPLQLRFDWERQTASALWQSDRKAPALSVSGQGVPLFGLERLSPRKWATLTAEQAATLKDHLGHSSFVGVSEKGRSAVTILVQEENMADKPSLLFTMNAEDILKYWSLLTPEQRLEFIELRSESLEEALSEAGLPRTKLLPEHDSMFATFAGIYHGFSSMKQFVETALEKGRLKDAKARLFGKKYDSLPVLISQVLEGANSDPVRGYVTLLCAQQVLDEITTEWKDFAHERRKDVDELSLQLNAIDVLRNRLDLGATKDSREFVAWFERWFLKRAPVREANA